MPSIAFIVVSKRINTRFFKEANAIANNVDCGTVIDNKVTLNERYDFFLVSQKTTQGTASPTNYNIIEDSTNIPPDIHHKLANCLTDVYYNWAVSTIFIYLNINLSYYRLNYVDDICLIITFFKLPLTLK